MAYWLIQNRLLFKFWFMFGLNQQAKVPNSSQYDFKGASVRFPLLRLNHPPVPTSPLLPEPATLAQQPMEEQGDHSRTRGEDSAISCKIRPTSLKGPSTGQLSLPRIPTTLRRTSKRWKKKSMFCWNNAWLWRFRVPTLRIRSTFGRSWES